MTRPHAPSSRTRTLILGVTKVDEALALADAGADALAFRFDPDHPRRVDPDAAFEIMGLLPPFVAVASAFTNPDLDTFCDVEEACPAPYAILLGTEPEKLVRQCGPGVIKALRPDDPLFPTDASRWNTIDEVDAILVQASDNSPDALAARLDPIDKPIVLAGIDDAARVAGAIEAVAPYALAFDLRPDPADALANALALLRAVREA